MPKGVLIKSDGTITTGEFGSLESLQAAVGGYIEAIYLHKLGVSAYVNEEGKFNGLPLNRTATQIARAHSGMAPDDFIVGDMLILGPVNRNGDDTDCPPGVVEMLLALIFRCDGHENGRTEH